MADETAKAFLTFSLGPVQSFIAAAHSVRDLWTGSYLLAWLTQHAMQPILDACGPAAFVSPAVKDNPEIDLHKANLRSPCLPNWFLAEVPASNASKMAAECERTCHDEWRRLCSVVRSQIEEKIRNSTGQWTASWANLWDDQIRSFFDIRTVVLPYAACTEAELERLLGDKRCTAKGSNEHERLWTDRAELAAAMLAATKSVRHIPSYRPKTDGAGQFAPKCSLMGSYEQMGPAGLDDSREFWEWFTDDDHVAIRGSRTRKRERLCAVSLVKRFVWAADLAKQVGSNSRAMRLEDTATVAAAKWLLRDERKQTREIDPVQVRNKRNTWSGQWLHWSKRHQDEDEDACPVDVWNTIEHKRREQGKPPIYYAILMLDGDRMGDAFRSRPGREHRRQISHAISQFARHRVPELVENRHDGTLIYSGGDDVLGVLPTATALGCALDLAAAFDETWTQHGPKDVPITVSAGLAVVHYKEDLRFALDTARRAEKNAKDSGRNTLYLTVCRRSGEHTSAICPWKFVGTVAGWVKAFLPQDGKPGASDRWAYHLAGELPTLQGLDRAAMHAEIRRQVKRSETATRSRLGETQQRPAGEIVAASFDAWINEEAERLGQARHEVDSSCALKNFVTLCQTASFLARGRDE